MSTCTHGSSECNTDDHRALLLAAPAGGDVQSMMRYTPTRWENYHQRVPASVSPLHAMLIFVSATISGMACLPADAIARAGEMLGDWPGIELMRAFYETVIDVNGNVSPDERLTRDTMLLPLGALGMELIVRLGAVAREIPPELVQLLLILNIDCVGATTAQTANNLTSAAWQTK